MSPVPDRDEFLAAYTAYIERVELALKARHHSKGLFGYRSVAYTPKQEMADHAMEKALAATEDAKGATLERLTRTGEDGEPQADFVDSLGVESPWHLIDGPVRALRLGGSGTGGA